MANTDLKVNGNGARRTTTRTKSVSSSSNSSSSTSSKRSAESRSDYESTSDAESSSKDAFFLACEEHSIPFKLDEESQTALEISALVSPRDCDELPMTVHKTPSTRVTPVVEHNVVADLETTPKKKIRGTPLPLLSWAESDEVWQNLVYKEEAMGALRNARIFDDRGAYLPRMRTILLDWIMEVCEVYRLRRNTYYLAVDYIDRFLNLMPSVPKTQLQLLGVACLFIAAKMEEIYPPKLSEFSYVCDGACTEDEILSCEVLLLNMLTWEVNTMTPSSWLNLYMQIHHHADVINARKTLAPFDGSHFEYPQYSGYEFVQASHLMDIFSMDPGFLRFSYSTIAAAAMHYAYGEEVALKVSGLRSHQLRECIDYMAVFTYVINDTHDPRLKLIGGSLDDDRAVRSFAYVRKNVPKLMQNEDHSIQTHLMDLDYFERSVLLRITQHGIAVHKTHVRKNDNEDDSEEAAEDAPTVYELTPEHESLDPVIKLCPPPHPTDPDYKAGMVNIFTLTEKRTVTFDDILASVHHDLRHAKIASEECCYS